MHVTPERNLSDGWRASKTLTVSTPLVSLSHLIANEMR